jgi:lysophospholipase L1-like esterase
MATSDKIAKTQPTETPTKKVVFFGDSLSDHGNNGKYTDAGGKVWSEIFPKLVYATVSYNYAISESSSDNLEVQISNYLNASCPETDKAIYSLLTGGNDVKNDVPNAHINIHNIIDNLESSINKIQSGDKASAQKQFLVFNLPTTAPAANSFSRFTHYKIKNWYNEGQVPDNNNDNSFVDMVADTLLEKASYAVGGILENFNVLGINPRAYFNQYMEDTNSNYTVSLKNLICVYRKKHIDVKFIDLAEHHKQIIENPDVYGVDPGPHCITSEGCENGLYFDLIHFSTKGHELFAQFVAETLRHPELQQTWECNVQDYL